MFTIWVRSAPRFQPRGPYDNKNQCFTESHETTISRYLTEYHESYVKKCRSYQNAGWQSGVTVEKIAYIITENTMAGVLSQLIVRAWLTG